MSYAGRVLSPLFATALAITITNGCAHGAPDAPDDDVAVAPGCDAACEAAAKAAFDAADGLYAPLVALEPAIPLKGPLRPEQIAEPLRRWLDEVNERLGEAKARYRRVLDLGSPTWSAAALYRLGALYEEVGANIRSVRAPDSVAYEMTDPRFAGVPAHLLEGAFRDAGIRDRLLAVEDGEARLLMEHAMTAEDRAAHESTLAELAEPLAMRALDTFEECAALAEDIGLASDWSRRCAAEVASAPPRDPPAPPDPSRARPRPPDED